MGYVKVEMKMWFNGKHGTYLVAKVSNGIKFIKIDLMESQTYIQ